MNRNQDQLWQELIHRHLDGIATEAEVNELSEQLESSAEARTLYLKLAQIHAMLATDAFDEPTRESESRVLELVSQLERFNTMLRRRRLLFTFSTMAAAVVVMVCGWTIWKARPSTIVEITAIEDAVRWTGDGGQVIEDLHVGQLLTGGTIEARSVDSFVELRFRDGTVFCTTGGSVLTMADDGQKKLYLRSGVLSADVGKQPAERPMIVVTPAARFEILGTRFDLMANPERSKVSVRQGLVRAVRLSDGKSVKVAGGHSAIASTDAQSEFLSRRSDQAVHAWKANLEQDRKQGEGEFVSAMLALRIEIREALQSGKVTREQIPKVYGDRLAEVRETGGILKAQPKQVGRSKIGNVVQMATLYVNRDKPNPVVLNDQSVFRVQGKVAAATEIHVGIGAFGTTRASAGRFITSHDVAGEFDVEIPVSQFRPFRGHDGDLSAIGMEVFAWFCLTSDADAELEISAVELKLAASN